MVGCQGTQYKATKCQRFHPPNKLIWSTGNHPIITRTLEKETFPLPSNREAWAPQPLEQVRFRQMQSWFALAVVDSVLGPLWLARHTLQCP